MTDRSHALDRLRQPEYTGDNRCVPCTAVNLAIAVVLTAGVAVLSPIAAPIVLGLSLAAIYFRGYLVPGTPTLTKRYAPDWLLARFDKVPEHGGPALETDPEAGVENDAATAEPEPVEPVDPEAYFLDHELVTPCLTDDGEEDLCLDDALDSAWRQEMDALRTGDRDEQIAAFLDTEPDAVTVTQSTDRAVARVDGRVAAQWESDAALIADLAGSRVLSQHLPEWDERPIEQRSQLASGLRAFVESCPSCSGPISIDMETVESCCRSHEVYAITCEECAARVLEVPAS